MLTARATLPLASLALFSIVSPTALALSAGELALLAAEFEAGLGLDFGALERVLELLFWDFGLLAARVFGLRDVLVLVWV